MSNRSTVIAQALLQGSWTTVYTVPINTQTAYASRDVISVTISSIVLCNQHTGDLAYHIRFVPKGETAAAKHIVFHTRTLGAKATDIVSLGAGIQSGDMIDMYAATADKISVSIFGIETS